MLSRNFFLDRWGLLERLKRRVSGRPARADVVSLIGHEHALFPPLAAKLKRTLLLAGCNQQAPSGPLGSFSDVATEWSIQPVYLCELSGGLVHLSTGIIHDPDSGKYVVETSWGWGKYSTAAARNYQRRETFIPSAKPVYPFTSVGYHGVMEDLSCLLLLRDLGMEVDVVIDERNQWMIRLLGLLLPQTIRVLPLRGGIWVRAERMVIATKSAFGEFVHPSLIATLRAAAAGLPGRSSLPRKLFVSRADTANRSYPHEGAIAETCQRHGFTPVTLGSLSVQDQLLAFREATHVAGLHGGGLANLVWGQESIDVLEFYLLSHYNSCYSSLCFSLGHPYRNHLLSENSAPPDLTGLLRPDPLSCGAGHGRNACPRL
jgi:hypothetical protein